MSTVCSWVFATRVPTDFACNSGSNGYVRPVHGDSYVRSRATIETNCYTRA